MSVPPIAAQLPQGKLPAVLSTLRALAEREHDAQSFYSQWLSVVCGETGAPAGRCWLAEAGAKWQPIAAVGQSEGIPELPLARLEELRRDRLSILAPSYADDDPAHVVAEVWSPWLVAGEVRGAVCAVFAVAHPQAQQGCLKFTVEACDAVERFHLLADRRAALRQVDFKERELELDAALRRSLDRKTITATIANDGRLFLGADRLAVLTRHGSTFRVAAVSGQTELAKRAGAVRALTAIADRCAPLRTKITFPNADATWDLHLAASLERYVDEHFVKRFVFVPLIATPPERDGKPTDTPGRWLGALIVETFGEGQPAADEAAKLDVVARSATAALAAARQYDSLFLMPVWRTLGNAWQACFGPGQLLRTLLVMSVVGGALAALFLTTTDYTAYCRGKLQPVERRRVFAPLEGVIRKLLVKHGDHVTLGQPLVELQNTDLDIATAELQGRRTAAFEQSLAVGRSLLNGNEQLSGGERARLSGEQSRLKEEIASFDRQLVLMEAKRKELVVASPIEGEITTWNADDLLHGRPVRQGQQMLTVAAVDGPWELELTVPDDRSGRIVDAARGKSEPLRVTYSPAIDPSLVREARVVEIQNSADLQGNDGNVVLVRAAIRTDDLPQRRPGAEAAAHVHCGRRSTAYVWTRDVVDFLRAKIYFRWF